jgi:uncharacterized protein (DUF433 family)
MLATPIAIDVPLRTDHDGTIRVGETRVTLESVIADYHRNATPEKIVENFPVLQLADVYQVIGYYIAHRPEVDTYIQRQADENARLRAEWEAEHPPRLTKADLLARFT